MCSSINTNLGLVFIYFIFLIKKVLSEPEHAAHSILLSRDGKGGVLGPKDRSACLSAFTLCVHVKLYRWNELVCSELKITAQKKGKKSDH